MKIAINERLYLSNIEPADKASFVKYLNDETIYRNTLRIPFPYTDDSADAWLALEAKLRKEHGQLTHWAIRDASEALIGCCGFHDLEIGKSHRAEIGYWLGRPFWGQGIMTAVVGRLCTFAFTEWGLERIMAQVHSHNNASMRVLEKCGFAREGLLRKHVRKDGAFVDVYLYARLREEAASS